MSDLKKSCATEQRVFVAYPACQDDEINLFDIFLIFWKNKGVIFGATCAGIVIAAIFSFLLPKIYRAEIVLFPPDISDIARLNVQDIIQIESKEVYGRFLENLQRVGIRYLFFDEYHLGREFKKNNDAITKEYEFVKQKFAERISVQQKDKRSEFRTVSLDSKSVAMAAQWLDDYITFVDRYTVRNIIRGIQVQLDTEKADIRAQLKVLRQTAKQHRLDKIARLQEAIAIAKRLNISDLMKGAMVSTGNNSAEGDVAMNILEVPLYLRGYKALHEELIQLQKRKSDDPFVPELRDLQGQLVLLEKKYIAEDAVHSIRVDQQAIVNKEPVKPKRLLMIGLGGILGSMLGILGVLVKRVARSTT